MAKTPEEIRKMEHKHEVLSYNKIDDILYAGNNMCCQVHFAMKLLIKGIKADISLEKEHLDNPKGVKYFFWFPWSNHKVPNHKCMKVAMDVMKTLRKDKIKTYVHCRNGHGRTSTFLAIYFMEFYNLTHEEALKKVLEKRPSAHWNKEQEKFIKKYYSRLS